MSASYDISPVKHRVNADSMKWWDRPDYKEYIKRVVLTTLGTQNDLERLGLRLVDGMNVDFWMDNGGEKGNPDPLLFSGKVYHDPSEGCWYAEIDERKIMNASQVSEK